MATFSANVEWALQLRKYFELKTTGEPASDEQIRADFEKVERDGRKDVDQRLEAHRTITEIPKEKAIELAIDDIKTKIKRIRRRNEFRAFDTYPFEAKLAVLDMAYQLGARGAAIHPRADRKEHKFRDAVNARNWKRAAELSHRTQAQEDRNVPTRKWLLKAAEKEPCWVEGKDHTQLKPVIVWGRGAKPALTVDAGPILL